MEYVFSTDSVQRNARYGAWRDAICNVYVNVDVEATHPEDYQGFIREAQFGQVILTDIFLSEQKIWRNKQHISKLDKDCYYLQIVHHGSVEVIQGDTSIQSNHGQSVIFCASEQYELRAKGDVRSLYLELPREEFALRFPNGDIPLTASLNTTLGSGRVATELCSIIAAESSYLYENRKNIGNSLMDVLAIAMQSSITDQPITNSSIKLARLKLIQRWIEEHLSDPELSLDKIAEANGISLRYLHTLFRDSGSSASEWIWNRRLHLAYDRLVNDPVSSITTIAFDLGFNSSSHFSTKFRRRFGLSPRDVRSC